MRAVCSAKERKARRRIWRIGSGDWSLGVLPSSAAAVVVASRGVARGGVGKVWYWVEEDWRRRAAWTASMKAAPGIGAPACRDAEDRVFALAEMALARGGRTISNGTRAACDRDWETAVEELGEGEVAIAIEKGSEEKELLAPLLPTRLSQSLKLPKSVEMRDGMVSG